MTNKKTNVSKTTIVGHPTAPDTVNTKEIERIIKQAKSVRVYVHKCRIPGGRFEDKFTAYMSYKIGDLEAGENLVTYNGKIFPDNKIISMIKKRAIELNPKAVEKCIREAEEWKKSQTHEHTR